WVRPVARTRSKLAYSLGSILWFRLERSAWRNSVPYSPLSLLSAWSGEAVRHRNLKRGRAEWLVRCWPAKCWPVAPLSADSWLAAAAHRRCRCPRERFLLSAAYSVSPFLREATPRSRAREWERSRHYCARRCRR